MAGLMACVPVTPNSSVCPSAGARATSTLPVAPPAPGRLSTITGWPSAVDRRWAMKRPMTSAPPPGANGTMIVMGFAGQACAKAVAATATASASAPLRHSGGRGAAR